MIYLISFLLLGVVGTTYARECTEADWVSKYTECTQQSNVRDLIYYKNPDTDECSGGVPMPEHIFNLPCDITCRPGEYLPRGSTECVSCAAGEYSLGGGVVITRWSNVSVDPTLPFTTYATDKTGATINGTDLGWYTDRGRIYLRSDSEKIYDTLTFSINGKEYLKASNEQFLQSFEQDLDKGYYTFTWKYSKDYTFSQGSDAAYIQRLEILGTRYADEECVKCDAGTYSSEAGSSKCASCPFNTYSDVDGATECTPCDNGTYAQIGSSECTERPACTKDDYTSHYTDCRVSQEGKLVRDLIYEWPEYTKCDYLSEEASELLPANEYNIECDACSPGMTRNQETGKCEFCGFDSYSDGTSECKTCGIGERADFGIYINKWSEQSVMDMFITNCTGQCNGNSKNGGAWELNGDHVISGVGNGNTFVSTLELIFNATENTRINVSYNIQEAKDSVECTLTYNDVGIHSKYLYRSYYDPNAIINETFGVSKGHHHIRFIFTSVTKSAEVKNYAKIYAISIPSAYLDEVSTEYGVAGGNKCTPCTQGTYSVGGLGMCELCAPGTSSEVGSSNCSLCPENTFNDVPGGLCRACGNNVVSPPGSQQCPLDCVYSPDNNKTVYDIRSLFKNDMYGPVYDGTGFQYFINICSLKHSNVSCIDEDGNSIDALACQVLNNCPAEETCTGKNLGMIAGYYPIDTNLSSHGFVLEYTGGDFGCDTQYRSTNISFICTPDAGVGFPELPDNKEAIEGPPCHYDFYWRSLYGCPLCTEKDYSYYFTECKDNKRTKKYYWNENPKACHDGVALPEDEEIPTNCTTQTVCDPGMYVDGDSGECTPCPAGKYSIGSGSIYSNFAEVPPAFTNKCSGASDCMGFRARNGYLISGYGYDSTLRYTSTFHADGTIAFDYSVYLPSSLTTGKYAYDYSIDDKDKPHFEFSVDDTVVLSVSAKSVYTQDTFTHNVPAGGHILQWRFVQPDSRRIDSDDFAAVELHSVTILGDKYSPLSCTLCPAGTHSADLGSPTCAACPAGTVAASASGASKCVACAADEYSYDGIACVKRPECTAEDWEVVYGPCVNGLSTREWQVVEPSICVKGSYAPKPFDVKTVECAPCPAGTSRAENNTGECLGCPQGKVYSENSSKCEDPAEGHAAIYSKTYFGSEGRKEQQSLPAGWSTGGLEWRAREGYVDSGIVLKDSAQMKSYLTYNDEIVLPSGNLSFEIACVVPRDKNVFLFVNGNRVMLNFIDDYDTIFIDTDNYIERDVVPDNDELHWHKFNVVLPRGKVELTWLTYYTTSASTTSSNTAKFRLRNVKITGLGSGESADLKCPAGYEAAPSKTSCEPCAPGSANPYPGGTCKPCTSGQFAQLEGSEYCKKCYTGSFSNVSATSCITSCSFTTETASYDLTPFSLETQGPLRSTDGSSVYLSICTGKFPDGVCGSTNNESSGFHVCRVAPNGVDYVNFGTNLKFTPMENDTFSLDFLDGDEAFVAGNGGVARSTHIDFKCNMNVGTGYPILEYANETYLSFSWSTYFACRNCIDSDYKRVVGKCKGTKAEVQLIKSGNCYGRAVLEGEPESCQSVAVPIYITVGAGVLLILLVVIIVFVVYRNRQVTSKYQNLKLANPLLADDDTQPMEDINSAVVN